MVLKLNINNKLTSQQTSSQQQDPRQRRRRRSVGRSAESRPCIYRKGGSQDKFISQFFNSEVSFFSLGGKLILL